MPLCNRCGEDKPVDDYYMDTPTRRKKICKQCILDRQKEKREDPEFREQATQYMRDWRAANPNYRKRNNAQTKQRDREREVTRLHRRKEV